MSFRTKSLMINVLPQDQQAQLQQLATPQNILWSPAHSPIWTCLFFSCTAYSPCLPRTNICQIISPFTCLAGTPIPDTTIWITTTPVQETVQQTIQQTVQFNSEEGLKVLQEQLAQLQEATQTQLDALQAKQTPQTVEEAEMLEKHLTDALNEVKATKESLRRSKPGK